MKKTQDDKWTDGFNHLVDYEKFYREGEKLLKKFLNFIRSKVHVDIRPLATLLFYFFFDSI
jgi:hypothetical protein